MDKADRVPGVTELDHLVLTVADIDRTIFFYESVLGLRPVAFDKDRRGLRFGGSRINLHQRGQELSPRAARAMPGSADLCLRASAPAEQIVAHLMDLGVTVEEGPVHRTGALGPIESVYLRDPDGNLIELASDGR